VPNIIELRAPLVAPEPTDIAATTAREAGTVENRFAREAGASVGGAISRVGAQVGQQIDRHVTSQWIGHGAANYSSLYGNLTQQWNDLAAKSDPNDTSIKQGFIEKVLTPSLEKFQQAFEGATPDAQDWALRRTNELRQHFAEKMSADMGTRAAAAVHQNIQALERNYSATVGNDPSTLEHITDSVKTDVEALVNSHDLKASDAARVRSEVIPQLQQRIAQSAFDGMAQRAPRDAIAALDHGDFNKYADEVTRAQWRRYAEYQDKLQKQDERQERADAERQKREDSATAAEEYRTRMYDVNTGRVLRVQPKLNQQILQDVKEGKLTRADGNALIRWNEQQYAAQVREDKAAAEGPALRNDERVLADLRERVGEVNNPTTRQEIGDALGAGLLTTKAAHDLAWRVAQSDAAWQAVQRPFKQQFDNIKHVAMTSPTSMLKYLDPQEQITRFNQIEEDAQRVVREAYASRDKELLRQVLDPKSPKWAFKDAMSQFTAPPGAAVKKKADEIRAKDIDVESERQKVSAAISGGVPEAAAKARFKERTGQDFTASNVSPDALKSVSNEPRTFEEFVQQQDALRPAVEAKGWQWQPDRWNYFINDKGQIDREGSPGRSYMQRNWAATAAFKAELDKLKPK
jgi:hypothetical protein